MSSLIHPNGALDKAAIASEVERRLAALETRWTGLGWAPDAIERQSAHYRVILTDTVTREAHIERNPFLQAAIAQEWTVEENAERRRLTARMNCQPISGDGNASYKALARELTGLNDAIRARAEQFLETGGSIALPLAAE